MQVQGIDRIISLRTGSAGMVLDDGLKVGASAAIRPIARHDTPGVVVQIDANSSTERGDPTASLFDRSPEQKRRDDKAASDRKAAEPPAEPISKMMMEFLHKVWKASGNAVDAVLPSGPEVTSGAPSSNDLDDLQKLQGASGAPDPTYSPKAMKKAAQGHTVR